MNLVALEKDRKPRKKPIKKPVIGTLKEYLELVKKDLAK
jgi:hypothetical protein